MPPNREHAHKAGERPRGVVVPLRGVSPPRVHPPGAAPSAADGTDPVTGLPGRDRFEEHLRGATRRRRRGEHPWVAVAVLAGTGAVSDREGRRAGEELLRTTAATLRASLRDSDKLARLGDEEFGMLLDAPYGDDAMTALERLAREVRELAASRPQWHSVSLSVGVTRLWSDEPEQALKRARAALYGIRSRGGGVVAMSTGLR